MRVEMEGRFRIERGKVEGREGGRLRAKRGEG